MVEQCGGKVEQSWWKSVVEQENSHTGTMWWKSGTVWWNSGTVTVEQCGGQWNSHGGTLWWNSGTLMVEQCNETVEQ